MKLNTNALGFEVLPHYCTHAIEAFDDLANALKRKGIRADLEEFLAGYLRESVKFLLPDNGRLFSKHDYLPKMFELQRLPFAMCALEFKANEELFAKDSGLYQSNKRIALCFDPHRLPEHLANLLTRLALRPLIETLPERCLAITTIYEANKMWGAAVGLVILDLADGRPVLLSDELSVGLAKGTTGSITDGVVKRLSGGKSKYGLPCTFINFPERCALVGQTKDEAFEALYIDTLDEVSVCYEFLAALNCANVGTTLVPPPVKLNTKRERNGKTPFYAYKTLDLGGRQQGLPGAGGAGTSPGFHLRRGHPRQLGEKFGNKTIWINDTSVNAHKAGLDDPLRVYKVKAAP